jgi:signal transduction histidine kinase
LHGFDKGWISAGNRRAAYYTKAPPGDYVFQVIAANNDNVWNTAGASVHLRILPLYWQTMWFRAAAILTIGGAALWFYYLRFRSQQEQTMMRERFSRRLIESQENERKRMAAELHDSLGQSLLVVNNYAAMALKDQANPEKVQSRLQKICDSAAACIEEVRSIARSLRPYQLDRFGLTKTLEDIGETLSGTGGLEVVVNVESLDGLLTPEAEISVYRMTQEWLNNVVKHAGATKANLTARREPGRLRLILEDNGKGFDYDAVMARSGSGQSFGLSNLRERARLLDGTMLVETGDGKGTRLIFELPYGATYQSFNR